MMQFQPNFWITSATYSSDDSELVFEVNGTPTIEDYRTYLFLMAPGIQVPSEAPQDTPAFLSIGGEKYPLWDKFGMPLKLSEIPTATVCRNTIFVPRKAFLAGIGSVQSTAAKETASEYHMSVWNLPLPDSYIIPLRSR